MNIKDEGAQMTVNGKEDDLFTVMFMVTEKDVLAWAEELGMPLNNSSEEMVLMLKEKIQQDASSWQELFEHMVKEAIRCPLDRVCTRSCT
jgi:hypothetical protein